MKERTSPLVITLLVLCFSLVPNARAVSPPPDGGYPGGNTAAGFNALFSLSTGLYNTAIGYFALDANSSGDFNTALGAGALFANTGVQNTATGAGALLSNTTGSFNTANGEAALFSNTTGTSNTAVGESALLHNTIANNDTAIGANALGNNTEGENNTAVGVNALQDNASGNNNTAIGIAALLHSTGDNNIAMGVGAGTTLTAGDNNIYIANGGVTTEDNTLRLGGVQTRTFIAGINGVDQGSPAAVFINTTTGQLGTTPPASSRRFKKDIKPMNQTSEAILGLEPVMFQYKSDTRGTLQFGLIAEEVAEVNRDLVVRDKKGDIYTVRYDAVNAMLLNEFLKEHKKVEQQADTIAELKKEMATVVAHAKEQDSEIQRVSAQLEVSKPAPQRVANK